METDLPAIAKALRCLDRADIKNWLRRGELLTQARELTQNETTFRKWVQRQGIAKRTAYKALAAWRDFGSVPTSARFSIEAMAILGASPEARAEAIEISTSKPITSRIAKDLVTRHTSTEPAATVAPPRRPLSSYQEPSGYEEIFSLEGFTITVAGTSTPTASDLLGVVMELQRIVRGRIGRAA